MLGLPSCFLLFQFQFFHQRLPFVLITASKVCKGEVEATLQHDAVLLSWNVEPQDIVALVKMLSLKALDVTVSLKETFSWSQCCPEGIFYHALIYH